VFRRYSFLLLLLLAAGLITGLEACNRLAQARQQQEARFEQFGLTEATLLGKPIYSTAGEYSPSVSADGKTLVFQSNRLDKRSWLLFITYLTPSGWTEPKPLENINSGSFDGTPFLTYDQNHLLISSRRPGGLGQTDIWISRRRGMTWETPVNLGAPINSAAYDGFASMTADGKTLYFQRYAGRESGCDMDYLNNTLMYSEKKDGRWSEPKPLPEPINTEYCETDPVILADGRTLIFSSNRPGGFGGFDLYKSERQQDGTWSEPVNLGSFINTKRHDQTVSIPASGDIMYFTSGEPEHGDLYWVPIPPGIRPMPVVTVTGQVLDADSLNPIMARITAIDTRSGVDTTVVYSNDGDGKYMVILNAGQTYDISVTAEGYTFYSTHFDLTGLLAYQAVEEDIFLERIAAGVQITLNNIYFEFNKYRLLDESQYELNRVIELMNEYPGMTVEIAGHTDSIASETYNLELSGKRAGAVVDYLVSHGIGKPRLTPRGYGEGEPVADNGTEEGRQKNRRVEFRIIEVNATE